MSHTYTSLLAHVAFSTKNRLPYIQAEIASRLHHYLGGICRDQKCVALAVGGVEDHVHLLISYPPTIALANLLRDIKANSSKWVHETFPDREFAWQPGYAGFSVSKSGQPAVEHYIETQAEHHKRMTIQEEFTLLIERHGGKVEDFEW